MLVGQHRLPSVCCCTTVHSLAILRSFKELCMWFRNAWIVGSTIRAKSLAKTLANTMQIASANSNITQQQQLQTTASTRQSQTATSVARREPTSETADYKSTNNMSGHDGTSRIISCSNRINENAKTHDKEKDVHDAAGFQTAFPH